MSSPLGTGQRTCGNALAPFRPSQQVALAAARGLQQCHECGFEGIARPEEHRQRCAQVLDRGVRGGKAAGGQDNLALPTPRAGVFLKRKGHRPLAGCGIKKNSPRRPLLGGKVSVVQRLFSQVEAAQQRAPASRTCTGSPASTARLACLPWRQPGPAAAPAGTRLDRSEAARRRRPGLRPWQTVYWRSRRLTRRMLFAILHDVMLMLDRQHQGRQKQPTWSGATSSGLTSRTPWSTSPQAACCRAGSLSESLFQTGSQPLTEFGSDSGGRAASGRTWLVRASAATSWRAATVPPSAADP